jgi:pseudouridine synthase
VKQSGPRKINLVLKTGRNREVRRLASACRVPLIGLERTRYGTIRLEGIERGGWRQLTPEETSSLCDLVRLSR